MATFEAEIAARVTQASDGSGAQIPRTLISETPDDTKANSATLGDNSAGVYASTLYFPADLPVAGVPPNAGRHIVTGYWVRVRLASGTTGAIACVSTTGDAAMGAVAGVHWLEVGPGEEAIVFVNKMLRRTALVALPGGLGARNGYAVRQIVVEWIAGDPIACEIAAAIDRT